MAAPRGLGVGAVAAAELLLGLLGFAAAGSDGALLALPVCHGCCAAAGPVRNGSRVAAFCAARPRAELRGRCCWDGAVLGLDLGNCSLHHLCPTFQEARTALLVELTDNPLEQLPEGAFQGFTKLKTLALPWALNCPGGSNAWDRISIQGNSRICQEQRNPCNGSAGFAWLCPEDALCDPDGPGLPQCLCLDPYHGYKCLRQGTFPYLLFYGTLGAITAVLSILLWVTQRRKVKAS